MYAAWGVPLPWPPYKMLHCMSGTRVYVSKGTILGQDPCNVRYNMEYGTVSDVQVPTTGERGWLGKTVSDKGTMGRTSDRGQGIRSATSVPNDPDPLCFDAFYL